MDQPMNIDEIEARIIGDVPIGRAPKRVKPSVELIEGDCRSVLAEEIADNSIDAIVTDPPYALVSISKRFAKLGRTPSTESKSDAHQRFARGFMGKTWDNGNTAFDPEFWADALRVLKPGGHVLAFGGTRTYHRLACAIEDAGFEIRDQIGWLYGSGFPKSHNQHGDWEGWGTALKPAWEPIVVARKPLGGTVAGNLETWGVGALNIDGCRVPTDENLGGGAYAKNATPRDQMWGADAGNSWVRGGAGEFTQPEGRWPANIIHDGSDEVIAAFPESNGSGPARTLKRSAKPDQHGWGMNRAAADEAVLPDAGAGSAARFFYCAKASRADRDAGLTATVGVRANTHPTVKPTGLMRYLCRLVTPPGGTVLDPFMGSGSTGRGAILEGFNFIGIEMDASYFDIADARVAAAEKQFMAGAE